MNQYKRLKIFFHGANLKKNVPLLHTEFVQKLQCLQLIQGHINYTTFQNSNYILILQCPLSFEQDTNC